MTTLRLTLLRKSRDLSQSELARLAGINRSTLSTIERGYLSGYPGQRAKIARALGIPEDQADWLFEPIDIPSPPMAQATP